MKTTFKSRFITVFIAIVIGFSALFGLISADKVVFAADNSGLLVKSKLEISTDFAAEELSAGTKFNIILNFSTTNTDTYWAAIGVSVGPLNKNGTAFDLDIAKKFRVERNEEDDSLAIDFGALNMRSGYNGATTFDRFVTAPEGSAVGCVTLGLYRKSNRYALSSNENVTIKVPVEVTEDIEVDSVTFGVLHTKDENGKMCYTKTDCLSFGDYSSPAEFFVPLPTADSLIEVNETVINLAPAVYLVNLDAGTVEDEMRPVDLTQSPASIIIDKSATEVFVKPTFSDSSITARIGTDKSTENMTGFRDNQTKAIRVPSGASKLLIRAYALTGEMQEYEVELVFTSIRLKNITASAGTAEMTALGIQGAFDEDTFAYTVKVPDSDLSARITATVPADSDVSEEIALTADGCAVAANTVTGGSEFTVSEITEGAKLTLTVKSEDGYISQNYVLTFRIASTDTSIKSITLKRGESVVNSDGEKAAEASSDYYFAVAEEEGYNAVITVADGAKYNVTGDKVNGLYTVGEYTVTVTAEAGNSQQYKVKIENQSDDGANDAVFSILKTVDFVAIESVAVNTVSCFAWPLRLINIIIWDIIVPIFG